jgi:hypothetical protein
MRVSSLPFLLRAPGEVGWSGCAPDSAVTFLCFAKEKSPKERRAEVRAAARFLALLASGGVGLNSLRSNNARPDPPAAALLSPATRHGMPNSRNHPTATQQPGRAMARPGCLWYSTFPAVMRRRVAQGWAGKGARMFERSEFARTPPGPSNTAYRRSRATNPARLFFGYFLLAKQKKVTALSGAHPDTTVLAGHHKKNKGQTC